MTGVNCSTTGADRKWDSENVCGDLPISFSVLIGITAGWILLFLIAGLRLIKLSRSSPIDTAVAKKMQFFQAWAYSLTFTIVELSAIFSAISLFESEEPIPGIFVLVFTFVSTAFASQVDVIGSSGKKQGINGVDFSVMLQYMITTYLPKGVWKLSGHKEHGVDVDDSKTDIEASKTPKVSKLDTLCCLQDLNNRHTPRVYDFKDVVGIQGAFLAIPTLSVLLLTMVRSNGAASEETKTIEIPSEEGDPEVLEEITEWNEYYFNPLVSFTAILCLFSAVLTPLLGDWETFHKNTKMCLGSLVLRAAEVVARVSFFTFLLDVTKFSGLLLLGAEFLAMWFTGVELAKSSSAGRVGTSSHKVLASWSSVFFSFYRRVHVDKELSSDNLTLMPFTIEFVRFLVRTTSTILGYAVIAGLDTPASYTSVEDDMSGLPALFYSGVIANLGVMLFHLANFFVFNRDKLSWSDLSKIGAYWMTLKPCMACCRLCGKGGTVHLNRDNNNFQAGGEPIHYL